MMNRRHYMMGSVCGGLALGTRRVRASASRRPSRPNLLFILTDDLGIGHFAFDEGQLVCPEGAFQHSEFTITREQAMKAARAAMPNTVALAGDSIRMRHAFAAAPICGPSRLGALTSLNPARLGIYDNFDIKAAAIPAERFLPRLLQQADYRTAVIGKWHLGRYTHNGKTGRKGYGHSESFGCHPDDYPLVRGFDYYYGFNPSGTAYRDSPSLYRNYERVKAEGYLTDALSDEAVQVVSKKSDDPFFLYLAYNAPHTPYDPAPKKYVNRFSTGNPNADNFFGMLAAVDDGIGRVVDALKESGKLENTLIVFASDNGAVSNSPLPRNGRNKGYKGMFYPGGTQVPMFVRYPGSGKTGWYEKPVSLLDLMPTFLAAAGQPVPRGIDGVDLHPFLFGAENGLPHETLCWAGPFNPQWAEEDPSFDNLHNRSSRGPAGGGVCAWPEMLTFSSVSPPELIHLGGNAPGPGEEAMQRRFNAWIKTMKPPIHWDRTEWNKLLNWM